MGCELDYHGCCCALADDTLGVRTAYAGPAVTVCLAGLESTPPWIGLRISGLACSAFGLADCTRGSAGCTLGLAGFLDRRNHIASTTLNFRHLRSFYLDEFIDALLRHWPRTRRPSHLIARANPTLADIFICHPAVLYSLTKRLSGVLSLPLTAHRSMAPGLEVAKKRDPESHIYDDVPPEVALLAATIVVLKMVYGLDGRARTADADDDPACALPRLDDYLAHLRAMEDEEAGETGELFGAANNRSVATFDDASVDAYLAFCEKALLGPRDEGTGRLAEFCPLEKREALAAGKPDRRAEARVLHAGRVSHESKDSRPGEHYPVFNARDVLGTLPQPLGLVVARGARWVGVPEAHVGGVVEKYERRFVRWWQTDRRRSRGGGSAPT